MGYSKSSKAASQKFATSSFSPDRALKKPVRAPFGYYGAKQRIASQIVKGLPPHNAWVEVFCGSAALTLAKPQAPIEVINDLDDEIVNLFLQLRNNHGALCNAVALTPYARAEFQRARETGEGMDGLERARRFLVAAMMTVNGTLGRTTCGFSFSQSYAREGREARVNRWCNLPERLGRVVDRLRGVRIENRDARELLEMFVDRPATLVYLDPPYFVKRDHGYVIDANDRDFHKDLLGICRRAKCMILLSAYENRLYSDLLRRRDGWVKKRIKTHTRDTSGKDYARTEVLWTNAQYCRALRLNRVPIRLSREEKLNNKVNPARPRRGRS